MSGNKIKQSDIIELILIEAFSGLILNVEQEHFIRKMIENIRLKKYGKYILQSAAGCGKTFLIKLIKTILLKINVKYKLTFFRGFSVLAPSHSAKNILNQIEDIEAERLDAQTIHRFLGAIPKYDDNGKMSFSFNNISLNNSIIFIDECSQITNEIYNYLKNFFIDNYVIFSGDSLQLPPVEDNSSVLNENENEDELNEDGIVFLDKKSKSFNKIDLVEKFVLKKNMRTDNQIGIDKLKKIRMKLKKKQLDATQFEIVPFDNAIQCFKKGESCIILSYSNISVIEYANKMRKALYGDDVEKFIEGEKLKFYGGYTSKGCIGCYRHEPKKEKPCSEIIYYNGDIIEIKELYKTKKEFSYKICSHPKTNGKIYKCITCDIPEYRISSFEIEFYVLKDQFGNKWYKSVSNEDIKKIKKIIDNLLKITKGDKKWGEYYNFINDFNADIRYIYSSTIYRSQGNQWDHVFFDKKNLFNICRNNDLLRLTAFYTAISRMKKNCYFLN